MPAPLNGFRRVLRRNGCRTVTPPGPQLCPPAVPSVRACQETSSPAVVVVAHLGVLAALEEEHEDEDDDGGEVEHAFEPVAGVGAGNGRGHHWQDADRNQSPRRGLPRHDGEHPVLRAGGVADARVLLGHSADLTLAHDRTGPTWTYQIPVAPMTL